ncbi:MAG: PAS domain-containing protein [Polyangiaceae bacterium]|jgi:photoactive yellow protein|nr:PAS domain-containing protein [Polyangiaceae bacterium]
MFSLPTLPEPELPPPFNPLEVDSQTDAALDALPFGVVCLDAAGTILRYNLAEARLARLDRAEVLGRHFFYEIAPCTNVPAFEGRVRAFLTAPGGHPTEAFSFLFDFQFGAQQVDVELVRAEGGRVYLLINRRRFLPPRAGLPEGFAAPLQRELSPLEAEFGVRRDEAEGRVVEVRANFFGSLRSTWSRIAPRGWHLFSREWGLQWGRLVVVDLEVEALEELGRSLRELPVRAVAERFGSYMRRQGWGLFTTDFTPATRGAFVVHVERSALAESIGRSDGPRCYLLAGMLGALFNHLAQKLLTVEEVCCRAQGAERCSFVVVGRPRRAALHDAMQQAGGRLDVVLRLLNEGPDVGR